MYYLKNLLFKKFIIKKIYYKNIVYIYMDILRSMLDNIREFLKPIMLLDDTIILLSIFVLTLLFIYLLKDKCGTTLTGGSKEDEVIVFTLYYVEWCPHCQHVKPEWDKLEKDESLDHIKIVKINCEENEDIVQEKNIEGFPTILLTHNGKESAYNGNREYAEFKAYLENLN